MDYLLHHLLERSALLAPDAEAFRYADEALTFATLNRRANGLAQQLLDNGARPGDLVNTVELFDSTTGAPVAQPVTATVRMLPEPVFDCGDVIGKVFEDRNGNGHQDPEAAGAITNQDIFEDMMRDAGFASVKHRNLSGGIVALHSGWKI